MIIKPHGKLTMVAICKLQEKNQSSHWVAGIIFSYSSLWVTYYNENLRWSHSKTLKSTECLWGAILNLSVITTLGKYSHLSKAQFMHLQTHMLWELSDIIHVENREDCHACWTLPCQSKLQGKSVRNWRKRNIQWDHL